MLTEHRYIWCFARFGTICTIKKNLKNTHGGVLLLEKLPALKLQAFSQQLY